MHTVPVAPQPSRFALITALGLLMSPCFATLSFAQDAPTAAQASAANRHTGWEFEIHAGFLRLSTATKVLTSGLPAPGPGFTTVLGAPSRQVPSWYFGDGAVLANRTANFTGDSGRIVPLDSVLTSPSFQRQSGAGLGFRVGHTITRHVLAEFSYDLGRGPLALTSNALTAIEATRASFRPYWDALLTRPSTANVSTSSTATIVDRVGSESVLAGDVAISVATVHGLTPYFTLGYALTLPRGSQPEVTLIGHYQFTLNAPGGFADGAPFSETDQVRVRFQAKPALTAIIGAGVTLDLTSHSGFRVDLRVYPAGNNFNIRLDTAPVSVQATPASVIRRGGGPSIQVSNSPGNLTSLSLNGVNHFDSFAGKGKQLIVSTGYFVRF